MGVPADHLAHDRFDHVAERERPLLLGHARMKHHLQQEIAEFVAEIMEIAAHDGVHDLVGLLDGVRRDGRKGLFEVPGTAAAGRPSPAMSSSKPWMSREGVMSQPVKR